MSFHCCSGHSIVILSFRYHSIILMSFKSFHCHFKSFQPFHCYSIILLSFHPSSVFPYAILIIRLSLESFLGHCITPTSFDLILQSFYHSNLIRHLSILILMSFHPSNTIPSVYCHSIILASFLEVSITLS